MNSIPEKPRKVVRFSVAKDGDRLSSFHDSILCHILSLIPTKCAARTSILSKRWKHLFLDVPKIVFNEDKLFNHGTFINFVNRRLILCKRHTITEFRLVLPKLPALSVINLWIMSLLFRNLKVLDIEETDWCPTSTPQCPPSEIFQWETLTVLKLNAYRMVLKFPKFVFFPNLKVLDLESLEIQCESESCRFDHEDYPQLEYFRLRWVRFRCVKDKNARLGLGISLCTLENLEISLDKHKLVKIDIDTPRLRQLKYNSWERDEDVPRVQISFRKSECLVSADLFSHFHTEDLHSETLFCNLIGVKDLFLSQLKAEDLTCCLDIFANLTHLELTHTKGEVMWGVLQSAPNLEVLSCQINYFDLDFFAPADVPVCLAQKLREIRLSNFIAEEEYIESDVGLVGFILQHGVMLEKLTLVHPFQVTAYWRMSTLEQLLKLPRRSAKCEIELQRGKEGVEVV